jgi:hypothetical protein
MPVGSAVTARLKVPVFGAVHGTAGVHGGETWSHLALPVETEKVPAVPAPEIATTWVVGLTSPSAYVNAIVVGVADTMGKTGAAVATAMVTFSVCVPAGDTMEIVPVQVVPATSPVWSTDTEKTEFAALAVKLPVGERVNQVAEVQVCSTACAVALVLD